MPTSQLQVVAVVRPVVVRPFGDARAEAKKAATGFLWHAVCPAALAVDIYVAEKFYELLHHAKVIPVHDSEKVPGACTIVAVGRVTPPEYRSVRPVLCVENNPNLWGQ